MLLENLELSLYAERLVSEDTIFDNRLIFGAELLVLKTLEQAFTGKVKCVFIERPYDTGSAFIHKSRRNLE